MLLYKTRTNHKNRQTMGSTINNETSTTEPPPYNGQQPKPLGALLMHLTSKSFAIDSVVVKLQKVVELAWRLSNICSLPSQRSNQINVSYYDDSKKRALDSQIVKALSNGLCCAFYFVGYHVSLQCHWNFWKDHFKYKPHGNHTTLLRSLHTKKGHWGTF